MASRVAFQPMRMRRTRDAVPLGGKRMIGRPELNTRDSARPGGVGHLASALRAGNNHEVRVVRIHGHLTAPVRQRPPFRPRYSVTSHNVFEYRPVPRFDTLKL